MNVSEILSILETGQCKIIDTLQCFVVPLNDFYMINKAIGEGAFMSDALTRRHGLVNFEIRLSPKEKGSYYVVAESEPLLDQLWAKKFKP